MLRPCPGESLVGRLSPQSDPFCCSGHRLMIHVQTPAGCVCVCVCVYVEMLSVQARAGGMEGGMERGRDREQGRGGKID